MGDLDPKVVQAVITNEHFDEIRGSGSILYSGGGHTLILTCGHVISKVLTSDYVVNIVFQDGSSSGGLAVSGPDLAKMEIGIVYTYTPGGREWPMVHLSDPDDITTRMQLFMISYVYGYPVKAYNKGNLSHRRIPGSLVGNDEVPSFLGINVPSGTGSSGAAVVDIRGHLVCMLISAHPTPCEVYGVLDNNICSSGELKHGLPVDLILAGVAYLCDSWNCKGDVVHSNTWRKIEDSVLVLFKICSSNIDEGASVSVMGSPQNLGQSKTEIALKLSYAGDSIQQADSVVGKEDFPIKHTDMGNMIRLESLRLR